MSVFDGLHTIINNLFSVKDPNACALYVALKGVEIMKGLDEVKVLSDKYESEGVKKGAIGSIILYEIRYNMFEVVFSLPDGRDYAQITIHVSDLELVRDAGLTDDDILEGLPGQDPAWWCKVEDGFILNLKGEKKNKIAYDYDS